MLLHISHAILTEVGSEHHRCFDAPETNVAIRVVAKADVVTGALR